MKRKIIMMVALLVLLVGCGITSSTTSPKRAVEDLFGKYQSLDKEVTNQLEDVVESEDLTATQKSDYEELMRKQYQNLTYTIKDEVVNGDKAIVTVEIEVFNYGKANLETETYVAGHEAEFVGEDDTMSNSLYQDYKLNQLKGVSERVKYTIDISLSKVNNDWKVDDLTDAERQKIHGLYSM